VPGKKFDIFYCVNKSRRLPGCGRARTYGRKQTLLDEAKAADPRYMNAHAAVVTIPPISGMTGLHAAATWSSGAGLLFWLLEGIAGRQIYAAMEHARGSCGLVLALFVDIVDRIIICFRCYI